MRDDRVLPDAQPCPNCGDPTPGNYCPVCGQRRIAHVLSLRRLVADAVEDQFSLNSALPRTLKVLFTHPGMLTEQYLRGRIATYIPPFRLYLLTSFVFFLTIAIFGCEDDDDDDGGIQITAGIPADSARRGFAITRTDSAPQTAGSAVVAFVPDTAVVPDSAVVAEADSAAARERRRVLRRAKNAAELDDDLDEFFGKISIPFEAAVRGRVRSRALRMNEIDDFGEVLRRELSARAPIVVFLLVPAFTAIMKLLYIRQRRFYVEHFVFALHLHSFIFFTMTLLVVLPGWWVAYVMLLLWLIAYIFLSMRRVYQQSKLMTLVKYIVLAMTYVVLALIALIGASLFTFLFAPV